MTNICKLYDFEFNVDLIELKKINKARYAVS